MWKKLLKWGEIVAAIYIIGGLGFYFLQSKFLFHPEKLEPDHVFKFGMPFKEVNLAVSNKKNINIVQFTVPDSVCKGTVLFFHGNRQNIERYQSYVKFFTKHNYEVWMPDYPGFGKSIGELTEEILYQDANLVYKLAKTRFAGDSIIIYGKSIGTGIAANLASSVDCKRLILETPYYSGDALMSHYAFMYPVKLLSKFHFSTYLYLESVNAPITIFHGTSDKVIPYSQAKELAQLKNNIELVTIPNGEHSGLNQFPVYEQKIDSLLQH
jgi:pimeloyl-ACP methyl ester carboxylesterase